MTKARTPDSPEAALRQAIVWVGEDAIAEALSNAELGIKVEPSTVRQWADPDRPGHINLHQSLVVDKLLRKSGHDAVFIELFKLQEPQPVTADEPQVDPLRVTVQSIALATKQLQTVERAKVDGVFERRELLDMLNISLDSSAEQARFRRVLTKLLGNLAPRGRGK